MSPWRLSDEVQESAVVRWILHSGAALLIGSALLTLFISPMSWPLLLIYGCLGILAGFLVRLGQVGGLIVGVTLVFGIGAAASALNRIEPQWSAAWWQPVLIAAAALLAVDYVSKTVRWVRQASKPESKPSSSE